MTIDGVGGDPTGAAKASRAAGPERSESVGRNKTSGTDPSRRDHVEISVEGRALSAGQEIDATRLTRIRERLDSGAYHAPEFVERLAQRLLPEIV